jgi:hypothetical protein
MDGPASAIYGDGVRKGQFAIVTVIVLVVATAGWHALGFILAAVFIFVAYWISLILHPRTRHTGFRSCNGTGEHRGAIFGWSHRRCPRCDGGRLIRAGAGQLGTEPVRREAASRRQARQAARDRHAWR